MMCFLYCALSFILIFHYNVASMAVSNLRHASSDHTESVETIFSLPPDVRIVGGSDAPEGSALYQVSLRTKQDFHFCGGSVLNTKWILTAAHCLDGNQPQNIIIVVGTHKIKGSGSQYEAEKLIVNSQFDRSHLQNDIAMARVKGVIEFNKHVQPINLPDHNTDSGVILTLTGWGTTAFPGIPANNLQIISLKSISVTDCQEKIGSLNQIIDTQICSLTKAGEGACHGDSGGPLVNDNSVVGIVSWGKPCAVGLPDVYTRVYSFTNWINSTMESEKETYFN